MSNETCQQSPAAFQCKNGGVIIVSFVFMCLIMTGAVFGNLLVVISVRQFPRLRNSLTNTFVVSLALADFMVGLVVMPFYAIKFVHCGCWYLRSVMCDIFNANDVMFSTCSIVHLCCISLERYIAILHPFHYERFMTRRKALLMLLFCWLYSALVSHLPIHTGWYATNKNDTAGPSASSDVVANKCDFLVNFTYALLSSCMSFYLPGILMTVAYLRIFREARRQEHRMLQMQRITARVSAANFDQLTTQQNQASASGSCSREASKRQSAERQIRREHKAAKTLAIIMGCFVLCWLPFFIVYVLEFVALRPVPETITHVVFWIGYFNSSVNPIIYAFHNRDFRSAFQAILCRLWCCGKSGNDTWTVSSASNRNTATALNSSVNSNLVETQHSSSAVARSWRYFHDWGSARWQYLLTRRRETDHPTGGLFKRRWRNVATSNSHPPAQGLGYLAHWHQSKCDGTKLYECESEECIYSASLNQQLQSRKSRTSVQNNHQDVTAARELHC